MTSYMILNSLSKRYNIATILHLLKSRLCPNRMEVNMFTKWFHYTLHLLQFRNKLNSYNWC